MKKNIVIIHYNTPVLTEHLVMSINKFVENAIIYIFDNSDKYPFTAKFDNVTILDNTKGQIIDFEKWLEKYPKKKFSNGKVNNWGSAKHCVSVQKCIDIINQNFLLIDSDVLIKKDISDLFDDNYIYCAEIKAQPNSTIKRVLPYLCFINVEKCNEKNVKYFNEKKMHGLNCIPGGDGYDTGASFYLNTSNLSHKDIKINEYALHYGHGSWVKKGYVHNYTPNDWLKINKKYWDGNKNIMEKNKKVVYTCITGGYDTLTEPKYVTEGFDYICFTDDLAIESDVWEIKPLPNETDELSQVKKQRFVKTLPHLLLSDYDISIWVDGNIEIKNDLNDFIEQNDEIGCSVFVPEHPSRKCIYDEERAVISLKKDTKENTEKQINRYKEEKFPKKNGLLQSGILLRKHNNEDCIKLMEKWWEEIKNGSHRDQLSFNYVSWKLPDIKVKYLDKKLFNSKWFLWKTKHTKKNMQNSVNNEIINIENKHREKIEKLRSRILSKEKIENKTKLCNIGANSKYLKKK